MDFKSRVGIKDKIIECIDSIPSFKHELEETQKTNFNPFIDVKEKVEIKEESMDLEEEYSENGQLIVLMKEEICPDIDLKAENTPDINLKEEAEIKDETLDIGEEYMENDYFDQYTGLDKIQTLISAKEDGEKGFRLRIENPSRDPPESSRRNNQNIKNNENDELDLHSKRQVKEEVEDASPHSIHALRMKEFPISSNVEIRTSAINSGSASALLNKNIKNDLLNHLEKISVLDSEKCSSSSSNNNNKTVSCPYCSKTFFNKFGLDYHIRTFKCKRPFKCSSCEKSFSQNTDLESHIRTHPIEKPYVCAHCDKDFKLKGGLKVHIRIHTGEKPFKCPQCAKRFYAKCNLRAHIRTHSSEKPFKCPCCNKRYRGKCGLLYHLRTQTGEASTSQKT